MNKSNMTLFLFLIVQSLLINCSGNNVIKANTPVVDRCRHKIVFIEAYGNTTFNGTWSYTDDNYIKQYNEIIKSDPELDAKFSISINNIFFIGLSGVTYIIPRVKTEPEKILLNKYGYVIICGTSDCVNDALPPLQAAAYDYASRYNDFILKELLGR